MEEDEEDLYSEMQLEEGRRRSINSHNTLKVHAAHLQPVVVGVGGIEEGGEEGGLGMEGWRGGGVEGGSRHLQWYLLSLTGSTTRPVVALPG